MTSSSGEEAPNPERKHSTQTNRGDVPPEYLGSVLRAEIMPADEAPPVKTGIGDILQRVNFRRLGIIVLLIVIIGSGLVCMIGPGRPMLESALTDLKERYVEPTPSNTPRFIPAAQVTHRITSTSTVSPTRSPTQIPPSTTPTRSITLTPTEGESCVDAVDIQLNDVGRTMCVRGVIVGLEEREVGFIVNFSDQRGVFYLVTYDFVWDQAEPGDCIQITGEIQQLGNTPVLVFGWTNMPEFCP